MFWFVLAKLPFNWNYRSKVKQQTIVDAGTGEIMD